MEAEALHRLTTNKRVLGFKLVRGRANRVFANEAKTKELLLKLKLSEDDIAPRSLVSPAQLEKLLKKTKKLFLWDKIKPMVDKPDGKLAIAPDTDPRPAVTRGQEFVTVDNEDDPDA